MVEFYDLPVYRLPAEDYERRVDEFVESYINAESMRDFYERNPGQATAARDRWRRHYGGAWQYNEIIGFIRLHFLGTQIRGEWWSVNATRITKTRHKQFEWQTHKLVPEIDVPGGATSAEIYDLITEYLDDCRRQLRGRFIDSSLLEKVGPYVDWRSLLDDA